MKILTQKLSSGEMLITEVTAPIISNRQLLIRNYYSVISAGTEGSTVKTARLSLLGKAKERPQQVKQVLEVLAQQGPLQTYRAVTKKLEAYSPLGYSSVGEVIDVGSQVSEFVVGDLVACAGAGYANHAEIISVPVNLCVKLKKDANLKSAAYNTLGAIALQSIRQADLHLGETCAVIGLGLLGQLAGLMLRTSGVRVIGIDVAEEPVKLAGQHFASLSLMRNDPGIEQQIHEFTNGLGVDAVIIAAASSSTDPINFAGAISRKKGKVVILGAVPAGFDRDPHWYKKELELKMSCSYGPGRYDLNYEEKGIDYPPAYVRWTEKRNMEAFQQMLADGQIHIDYLTTHEFSLDDAPKAYDMVVNKTEPYLGILIKYDVDKTYEKHKKISFERASSVAGITIGFIGAGSYAQSNLLPNLPVKRGNLRLKGVLTSTGTTSRRVAERFGFDFCTSDENDVLTDKDINTLFIATRHDSHAEFVIKGLEHGKHVFVEKPLCLKKDELSEIIAAKESFPTAQIMVGFNRRFSILSEELKKNLGSGPMSMIYRVNAGNIPGGSWIQDMEIGGGRIIGEACHFIDYLTWLNGSIPVKINASALPDAAGFNDTVNITISFQNGSQGIVAYYANGPKSMPKEYIEVFQNGFSGSINNFKEMNLFGKTASRRKLFNADKGQAKMVEQFISSLKTGNELIPFAEIVSVTEATFAVLDSIRTGNPVSL